MWVSLWLFMLSTVVDMRTLFVSAIGPAALLMLFQASTQLTESIAVNRYPDYKEYQATVSKFIPMNPTTKKTN